LARFSRAIIRNGIDLYLVMGISAPDGAAGPGKSGRDFIRDLLRLLLVLCFLGFFLVLGDFATYRAAPQPLPEFLGQVLVVVVLALACYLLLVRIETERWGLVHPVLRNGLAGIRANSDYKKILLVVNGCFLAMVVISVISGYVFSRSGRQFLVLCVSIWVTSDLIALWFLGKGDER
jgi:hypothetical protein